MVRKPEIAVIGTMIGIRLPEVLDEVAPRLVDGDEAHELGLELIKLGRRLDDAHLLASQAADQMEDDEDARAEFIRSSMRIRLGIDKREESDAEMEGGPHGYAN
jgi:hypothetical protein